jgi:hypothetical protein
MNSTLPATDTPEPPAFRHSIRLRWPRLACIASAAALLLAPGLRAQSDAPKNAAPPAPAANDPAKTNHPRFEFLHSETQDAPELMVMNGHARVGESFPVQEKDKPKYFDVKVVELDKKQVTLELIAGNKSQKTTMPAKHSFNYEVGGARCSFVFTPESSGAAGNGVTDLAGIYVRRESPNAASSKKSGTGTLIYSVSFDGGDIFRLKRTLQTALPDDNFVIAQGCGEKSIQSFILRDVRLEELANTISFLSDGSLEITVSTGDAASAHNTWFINSKRSTAQSPSLKMHAVAAPHLFGDDKEVDRMMQTAAAMEDRRIHLIMNSAPVRNGEFPRVAQTHIEPLPGQKVFVLIGTEEGVAGAESFIKAAEQLAVEQDAKILALKMADEAFEKQKASRKQAEREAEEKAIKQRRAEDTAAKDALAAAIAPKMHAVAAPHLFGNKERLDRFTKEAGEMREWWIGWHQDLMKETGGDSHRHVAGGDTQIKPRPEQKIFVLLGSEEGIAGMESLIQAAEKIAADEDAKILALKMAAEARDAADKAEALRQKALDEKYRKGTPQNP